MTSLQLDVAATFHPFTGVYDATNQYQPAFLAAFSGAAPYDVGVAMQLGDAGAADFAWGAAWHLQPVWRARDWDTSKVTVITQAHHSPYPTTTFQQFTPSSPVTSFRLRFGLDGAVECYAGDELLCTVTLTQSLIDPRLATSLLIGAESGRQATYPGITQWTNTPPATVDAGYLAGSRVFEDRFDSAPRAYDNTYGHTTQATYNRTLSLYPCAGGKRLVRAAVGDEWLAQSDPSHQRAIYARRSADDVWTPLTLGTMGAALPLPMMLEPRRYVKGWERLSDNGQVWSSVGDEEDPLVLGSLAEWIADAADGPERSCLGVGYCADDLALCAQAAGSAARHAIIEDLAATPEPEAVVQRRADGDWLAVCAVDTALSAWRSSDGITWEVLADVTAPGRTANLCSWVGAAGELLLCWYDPTTSSLRAVELVGNQFGQVVTVAGYGEPLLPYVVQLPDGQVEVGALTGIGLEAASWQWRRWRAPSLTGAWSEQ